VITRVLSCREPRQGAGVFSLIEGQSATDLIEPRGPRDCFPGCRDSRNLGPPTVTTLRQGHINRSSRSRRTSSNKRPGPFFF